MLAEKSHRDVLVKNLAQSVHLKPAASGLNRLQLSEDSLDSTTLCMVTEKMSSVESGPSVCERELSRQIVQLFSLSELVSISGKKSSPLVEPTTASLPLHSKSRKAKTARDTQSVLNLGQHFALASGRVALTTLAEEMKLSFDREEKTRYKLVLDHRGILKSFRSSNYKFPLKLARREVLDNSITSEHTVFEEISVIF